LALSDLTKNWQGSEISSHPDEAGHFVTGMMVFDYLRAHAGEPPLAFAEQYYARYPKVALGHWPPGYYVLQSAWFAVAGPGIWQAHALNWILVAAFAALWIWGLRGFAEVAVVAGSLAWLISLPALHRCAEMLLSDWAVLVWTWAAALLWLQEMDRPSVQLQALWISAAALAILTKGNAWMLLPALTLAPALAGEWRSTRWRAIAAICLLSAPFYLWAAGAGWSYPLESAMRTDWMNVAVKRWRLLLALWTSLPWPIWAAALLGFLGGWKLEARRWRRLWIFASVFCVTTFVFLLLSGLSFEDRAMILTIPFLCYLILIPAVVWRRDWGLACLALFALERSSLEIPAAKGYRGIAATIRDNGEAGPAVLVVSDSIGEGAVVAHILEGDERRERVVLRGSRLLSQQAWNGHHKQERYDSGEEMRELLERIPVQWILLDSVNTLPYATKLRALIPEWRLLERRRNGGRILELYAIEKNFGRPLPPFRLELGLERGGRPIEYRPGPL
jgi:hypothetical protein